MTPIKLLVLPLALLAAPLAADAQDWRDGRSLRRLERGGTEVFWDGNCRVEQRLNRNGELMERRSCRGDRGAYARAERNGEAEPAPERANDERQDSDNARYAPRYADDAPPRRENVYREPPPEETAPVEEPVALAPHIIQRAQAPMQAPRAVTPAHPAGTAPLPPATPALAKAAAAKVLPAKPVPPPAALAKAPPKPVPAAPAVHVAAKTMSPAPAPRTMARPAAPMPRMAAKPPTLKAAPALPRALARTAPAAARPLARPMPVRSAPAHRALAGVTPAKASVKAAPPRLLAKAQVQRPPVAKPMTAPRLLAKAAPAVPQHAAMQAAAAPHAVVRKPLPAPPAVLAGTAPPPAPPQPTPAVAQAAEVAPAQVATATTVKKSGTSKSEWLVVLQPPAAGPEGSAKPAPEAAALKPHGDAKAEHAMSPREYEAYIAKKRREPYSNL